MIPAYGPHWRYKIAKHSGYMWHLFGIYSEINPRRIWVAPWNRRRRPKKKGHPKR